MDCSRCGSIRTEDQFFWNGARHNTCIKCKESRDQNNNNVERVDLKFLELGDLVEHEIRELIDNTNTNNEVEQVYQEHLLVRLDIDIQNMSLKEIANLVITEIEGGDDYSWK